MPSECRQRRLENQRLCFDIRAWTWTMDMEKAISAAAAAGIYNLDPNLCQY
jgi:hypothetical protein